MAFYRNDRLRAIEVDSAAPLQSIEGFCVLSAYEDRVTPESDEIIPINHVLDQYQLVGSEAYWHLIVKSAGGVQVAVFNSTDIRLASPRPAFNGKNCVLAKSIRFEKHSTWAVTPSASDHYLNSKPDLDIQHAKTQDGS